MKNDLTNDDPIEPADALAPFLASQAWVTLDGGMASELERLGADLNHRLWSARLLYEQPGMIRKVHESYLAAGADVISAATYQATMEGFAREGFTSAESAALMRRGVVLAQEARDRFWSIERHRQGRQHPLVAAAVSPYGAFLADGSEYRGDYGLSIAALREWHWTNIAVFAAGGADLLAFETIPSLAEAKAVLMALSEFPKTKAWISFTCHDEARLPDGTTFAVAVAAAAASPQVMAVGLNCTAPRYVAPLLASVRDTRGKPLLAYPNRGDVWDAEAKQWRTGHDQPDFGELAKRWHARGARLIGGCCRTTPEDIRRIRQASRLVDKYGDS
jgi:homocysteine S-methyltransferase